MGNNLDSPARLFWFVLVGKDEDKALLIKTKTIVHLMRKVCRTSPEERTHFMVALLGASIQALAENCPLPVSTLKRPGHGSTN